MWNAAVSWKNGNDVTTLRHEVIVKFFSIVLFFLSSLVTGPSFMSIPSLVLELWQFLFPRDWAKTRKSEIPPSEFCPISGHWPSKEYQTCYWILQNTRVTAFTVSELLSKEQQWGKIRSGLRLFSSCAASLGTQFNFRS